MHNFIRIRFLTVSSGLSKLLFQRNTKGSQLDFFLSFISVTCPQGNRDRLPLIFLSDISTKRRGKKYSNSFGRNQETDDRNAISQLWTFGRTNPVLFPIISYVYLQEKIGRVNPTSSYMSTQEMKQGINDHKDSYLSNSA